LFCFYKVRRNHTEFSFGICVLSKIHVGLFYFQKMKTTSKPSLYNGLESLGDFKQFLANSNYSEIVVLVDENTQKFCLPLISEYIGNHTTISVKSGEESKSIHTCLDIWKQLSDKAIDRKALIINLGGGVICDMGGFIAATYKRGIDFVNIPTTLLAMCDASIGGKLGVNLDGIKNAVGLFKNPKAIVLYTNFLKTLPERHFMSGYAEIIKHALIGDKRVFKELLESEDIKSDIEKFISRSIRTKNRIVNLDIFEQGIRKSLNFGHTVGHALETFFLVNFPGQPVHHGEAIAAGMIAESYISWKKKYLEEAELQQISRYILKEFPKLIFSNTNFKELISYTLKDKKNEHQQRLFTLIDGIGQFRINEIISEDEIRQSLEYYISL